MTGRDFQDTNFSRRALLRSGAFLTAGAAATALPFGSRLFAHGVDEFYPEISRVAQKYLSEGKVANLMVAIGRGQEEMAHTIGGGTLAFDSNVEVGLDTLYRIYSMTKPITGVAAMMCIEDGLFTLETPLADFIPAFSDMQVLTRADGPLDDTVPADGPITIRHLLTHTAGFSYGIMAKGPLLDGYIRNGIIGGRVSRNPIPGFPRMDDAASLEEFAAGLATLPLIAQPGTKWNYSVSLDLLGRVIEIASGMSFEAFLQTRIFDPCGMASTYFTVPTSERARMTTNYVFLGPIPLPLDLGSDSVYFDEPGIPSGGAGLVSSARDYDRFLRMLLGYGTLDGVEIMESETVRTAVSNLLPEGTDTSGSWIAGEGHGAGGRTKNGRFGWGGMAGTLAAVDFKLGLRTGLYTQYMPPETYPIREEFLRAMTADLQAMAEAA